ncbi:MAG: zinc ribbon domain-containing protein [Clostridiales bacterium]|nr:zinc ribbon domain-containing protein [Clostridiales bacterium]
MYCTKCGAQVRDGDRFCPSCGAALNQPPNYIDPFEPQNNYAPPAPPPQNQYAQQQPEEENYCAILGFIFSFFVPIVGLILSILGLNKRKYHSLAVAGLAISIIWIVFIIIGIIIGIIVIATYEPYVPYYPYIYANIPIAK